MKLLETIDSLVGTCPSFHALADEASAALRHAFPRYRRVEIGTGAEGVPIRWGGDVVARLRVDADDLNDADQMLLDAVASRLAAGWGRFHDAGRFDTRAAQAGARGGGAVNHPVSFPVYGASTYAFEDMASLEAFHAHPDRSYIYTRWGNPTVRAAEEAIAALEGAEASVLHASGMGAIANAVLSTVSSGDVLLSAHDTYGGTHHLFTQVLPRFGVTVRFAAVDALAEAISPGTRAVYLEPVTNPTMRVVDLPRIVAACRDAGACLIVDNTVASPVFLRPLELGADIVVHSATKYLGGHSDLIAGVASGSRARMRGVGTLVRLLGACFNPREASLLMRGLATLPLRVRRQDASARALAAWLETQPQVLRVWHPSLPSHPDHALANRLMPGFGCLVTLELASAAQARRFVDRLTRFQRAVSLGGVESLVTIPVLSSHWKVSEESLRTAGVTPATVRLSVGIEDVDDLMADLARALREDG